MADSAHRSRLKTLLREELSEFGDLYIPRGTNLTHKESSNPTSGLNAEHTSDSVAESTSKSPTTSNSNLTLPTVQNLDQLQELCLLADELKTDLEGTQLVFGVGNPQADLMIIGEAPGEQEDMQGIPFVGRAGKLLDDILQAIQMDRTIVYIANILKHRPPGNRNPTEEERQRSLPFLQKQIELVQPKLILCLGKISASTLLGSDQALGDMRGTFHPFGNAELLVTYHPAALLRNPNWKRPTWEDVQLLQKRYMELGCKPDLKTS